MTLFADLRDLEECISNNKAITWLKLQEINSDGRDILGEIAGLDIGTHAAHDVDALDGEETNLAVPRPGVRIGFDAMVSNQAGGRDVML